MNFLVRVPLEVNTTKIQAIRMVAILNTMGINKTSMIQNILQVIQAINNIIANLPLNNNFCMELSKLQINTTTCNENE